MEVETLYCLLMAIYLMIAVNGRAEDKWMKHYLTGLSIIMAGIAVCHVLK